MANNILYSIGGSSGSTSIIDKYPPNPVTNLVAEPKSESVQLTWTDPEDLELVDSTVIKWAYTRIVRKIGSVPEDINDGTIVINNSIKNQYQTNPYIDDGLANGSTYYYVAFSVSETEGVNVEGPSVSATPIPYKIMTVIINEADRNPATCCTYADDAIGMASGKNVPEWNDFFGYKPCLFKDGTVVDYLNPNDFTKFANGNPADITSGDAGDVMVEFPRRGVKISKSGDTVTVSMTDNPDNPDFTYYAHTRGTTRKEYFYLGSYLAYKSNNIFHSLSGKSPSVNMSSGTARSYAHNRGNGYELFTFYQFTYLQVMYLLQFKNLDSQTTVGKGYVQMSSKSNTGSTDTNGMIYGTTSGTVHVKLFGIEDLWGNLYQMIDGFSIDDSFNYMTATDGFNDDRTGYVNAGKWNDDSLSGHITKVAGSNEAGFALIGVSGSTSTYYCDHGNAYRSTALYVGGYHDGQLHSGMFYFQCTAAPLVGITTGGSRLSYY